MFSMARIPTHKSEASRRQFLGGLVAAGGVSLSLPALLQGQATTTTTTRESVMSQAQRVPNPLEESIYDSHVGNLLGPVERIRDAYGWASGSFAQDKFAAADFPVWQRTMREVVFEAMKYRPAKADFRVETVERVDRGSYVREKIYFNTTPEVRVPAYVLVPKDRGAGGRAPAIVALHD